MRSGSSASSAVEHLLEVGQWPRREAVALGGLDVQLVEGREVVGGADG